ncbi:MAG: SPOR domain-containing protein [Gammaproteobacteria bacterium]
MRERWIGAIVLIVIAAIMVPWLMTHAHHPRNNLQNLTLAAAPPASAPGALALPSATAASAETMQIARVARIPQSITPPVSSTLALMPAPRQVPVRHHAAQTSEPKQTPAQRVAQTHASKQTRSRPSVTEPAASRKPSRVVAHDTASQSASHTPRVAQENAPPKTSAPTRITPKRKAPLGQGILHKGDWYVQVASFASHANAAQMAILLTRAGYHAFLSSNESGGTLYYRVRVGPYPSETRARAVAPGLTAVSGSQVVVRQADGSDG